MSTSTKPQRANRKGDSQALPTEGVQDVGTAVIKDITNHGVVVERVKLADAITADVQRRIDLGIQRYGRPLQTFNGRVALVDAYEESLDLANYLKQHTIEHPRDAKARLLYWNALAMVFGLAEAMLP